MAQSNPTGCCSLGVETIRFKVVEACCAECWAHVAVLSRPSSSAVAGEGDDHWSCGNGQGFTADVATDVLTCAAHGYSDDDPVKLCTDGTLPAPFAPHVVYYVRDATTDTFKLASTEGGTAIDVTNVGTGSHTVHLLDLADEEETLGLIVWDAAGCFLNEPNADLVDRVGYATRLTAAAEPEDPCDCLPTIRWEITSLCCPEDVCE